ncbi:hypothetical protein CCAL13119_09160, partial [Campylobacter sp. RM13119]|nr:hypothetical protein [Campylobacter sp. RM13119]
DASKRAGGDDAKRGSINSGGSSETIKIPAFCDEYGENGLCGQDDGSRNLRTQNKGSINGCTIYNLHDNHSISGDIFIEVTKQGDIDENKNGYKGKSCVSERKDEQARIYAGQYADGVRSLCECYGARTGCEREICSERDKALHGLYFQAGKSEAKAIKCEAVDERLPLIATCSDKKRKAAFEKYEVIKEWEKAKGKVKDSAFIEHINSKNICSIKVTANKLYDWQRKYKNGGLDALVDERTNNKTLTLEALGLKDYAIKLIAAQQGRINVTNIYNLLNYEAIKSGKMSLEAFNGKRDEVVSYEVVNRFVKGYLAKNRLLKNIILYGEDGAVSRHLPSLGVSNWAVDTINQVVEIDASPLDLICNASDICDMIGFKAVNNIFKDKDEFETYVKEWQKRYTIIALIDTYSGVATFHITDTENSVGIARAVAKYILRYGKPQVIKGDNGKAFKSEYINSVMNALEIEYRAVRAYSG